VIFVSLMAEKRNWVLLADVLKQDHQDVRSVKDLTDDLTSLFGIKFFKNVKYFCNDLADL
jgi:hypothetical protein